MMLCRVLLLVGVARVAGFAQTPSSDGLMPRSTYNADEGKCAKSDCTGECNKFRNDFCRKPADCPEDCPEKFYGDVGVRQCDTSGVCCTEGTFMRTASGKCSICPVDGFESDVCELAYKPITEGGRGLKKKAKKNCLADNFCYFTEGTKAQCEYYKSGCDADQASSDCSNYRNMVEDGSCPVAQEIGESTFCSSLTSLTDVTSCDIEVVKAAGVECEEAYIITKNHPFYEFPDNMEGNCPDGRTCRLTPVGEQYLSNAAYQRCQLDKDVCQPAKSTAGKEALAFCGAFCETMAKPNFAADYHNLGENNMCQKGLLDDLSDWGLPARLRKQKTCEESYYQIGNVDNFDIYQGCEWLGPSDIFDPYSATDRCQPDYYCEEAYIKQLLCFPACNCLPLRSTPCTSAQVMCCEGPSCNVCSIETEEEGDDAGGVLSGTGGPDGGVGGELYAYINPADGVFQ